MEKKWVLKQSLCFLLPSAVFLVALSCFLTVFQYDLIDAAARMAITDVAIAIVLLLILLMFLPFMLPVGAALAALGCIIFIPFRAFSGGEPLLGMSFLLSVIVWIGSIPVLWACVFAFKYQYSSFEKAHTYEKGEYLEVTVEQAKYKKNAVLISERKVTEIGHAGGFISNCWIYNARLFILLFFGWAAMVVNLLAAYKKQDDTKKSKTVHVLIFLALLAVIAGLVFWGYRMIVDPLHAFGIHYVWVILLYVTATVLILDYQFSYDIPKWRETILRMGMVVMLVLALGGMVLVPNVLEITNIEEFETIYNLPRAGARKYELTVDLDFEGKESRTYGSIRTFSGSFDGRSHTIRNITKRESLYKYFSILTWNTAWGGGFVGVNRGAFENLYFESVYIHIPSVDKDSRVGILAGNNEGYVSNCSANNCLIMPETVNTKEPFDGSVLLGGGRKVQ